MKRILSWVVLGATLAPAAAAQSRPAAPKPRPTAKAAAIRPGEPAKEPQPVDLRATFTLGTSTENWCLDDPIPTDSIEFGGRRMSLDERMVNVSRSSDGQTQYLFPVSWFEPYQSTSPDLKYVVVKYKDGKACSIMAEFLPNRVAMPRAEFQAHPDGRTYYSDVAVVRHGGSVYLKQAISQGKDDGKGGLWVDMILLYSTEDKTGGKP
jgi:hypothetical protein